MRARKYLVNKPKLLRLRERAAAQYKNGLFSPHRVIASKGLADSVNMFTVPFERMAYIGDYPEVFLNNLECTFQLSYS